MFPSQRALEENGEAALEEERRLAYVGLTRARHRAYVSFTANRRIHGQWQNAMRSRFVDELPSEHIAFDGQPGLQPGVAWESGWHGAGDSRPAGANHGASQPWARGRLPALIEARPEPRRGEEIRKVGGYSVGERIFNQKFGYGTITEVADNRLTVRFDLAGDKKVMDAYVEPA